MRRAVDLVARLQARQPNDRSLGQHFLIDETHLNAIATMAGDLHGRTVLEIGPGPGTLTEHLLRAGAVVHAIEIDAVAVDHLRTTFAEEIEEQKLVLTEGDALEATWPDKIDAVVSNIPYQISSPLIDALEKHRQRHGAPDVVVLLVQEEFAERLTLATPADRGSLGICTASDGRVPWNVAFRRGPSDLLPPSCRACACCGPSITPRAWTIAWSDKRSMPRSIIAAANCAPRCGGRHAACPAYPAGMLHDGKRRSLRWRTTRCSIYAPRT